MSTTTGQPMPDLAEINRAELWLAYFRQLTDQGQPIAAARRLADERFGFRTRP
jgi:hypothetical protein